MISNLKSRIIFILISLFYTQAICQIQPLIKAGVNIGFINKEEWSIPNFDVYSYGKPLVRPIVGIGLTHTINRLKLEAAVMYQTKGQGSKVPRVRNFFQSVSPDAIHFMSFPVGVEYRVLKKLGLTFSIQPSVYLGGVDNYYASEFWRGWIWNVVPGIQYSLSKHIHIGFEYDHDLKLYYCAGCDERFLTYRFFTKYLISSHVKMANSN